MSLAARRRPPPGSASSRLPSLHRRNYFNIRIHSVRDTNRVWSYRGIRVETRRRDEELIVTYTRDQIEFLQKQNIRKNKIFVKLDLSYSVVQSGLFSLQSQPSLLADASAHRVRVVLSRDTRVRTVATR